MGLLDVLNGMQNGPRGQPQSSAPGSGGMSKTTMALLAFLAYKAFKGINQPQPAQAGVPSPNRGGQDREPQALNRAVSLVYCAPSLAADQYLAPS